MARAGSGTVAPGFERVLHVDRYDEDHCLWYFEDDVASVDGPCLGLRVGGHATSEVAVFDPSVLLCSYKDVPPGAPWQLVADDVQLTFDPPHDLEDGSGTVTG